MSEYLSIYARVSSFFCWDMSGAARLSHFLASVGYAPAASKFKCPSSVKLIVFILLVAVGCKYSTGTLNENLQLRVWCGAYRASRLFRPGISERLRRGDAHVQVLPKQAVGAFVDTALSGMVLFGEVNFHACTRHEFSISAHLVRLFVGRTFELRGGHARKSSGHRLKAGLCSRCVQFGPDHDAPGALGHAVRAVEPMDGSPIFISECWRGAPVMLGMTSVRCFRQPKA